MKILIADIPDEGLEIDLEEKIETEDATLFSPVFGHLEVNRTGDEIEVRGGLHAELGLRCSRCLKDFERRIDIPVSAVYLPVEDSSAGRHALRDDEMDTGFYKGEELDLHDLVREQVLLNIQIKPLCSESCKGLCPKCGADLNTETCSCVTKEIDPRLEVLKNFLEKRKE
ncbi:MAG: DUF177 domain-containing protein [Candidatus Sulfobium sp.]|jgi:uncharacterized protein